LEDHLDKMDDQQKKTPEDWGFAGSMGHIEEGLNELVRFAGGAE
jgi:hypothetical protein